MRFAFTMEQELLRDALREVLARDCAPAVVRAAWSSEDGLARPLWRTLADVGVVGLTVPEAHGGLGLDLLDAALLFEEHGFAAAPTPLVETMAVAAPLLRDATGAFGGADRGPPDVKAGDVTAEPLAARWLPAIAKGEAIVAVGLDEARAVRNAASAHVLVLAKAGELHAVPRSEVETEPVASVDGSRRLARVAWTASDATRFASGDRARALVADARDRGAVATAAELVGLARRMITMTVEYAKTRRQFGAPIGSFQAVKHHLASAHVKIELARPAVHRAAWSVAKRDPERARHASIAKAAASDAATLAARAALQCHGAIGYSFEHDLHLWMKRAWALASSYGDAAWHRARLLTPTTETTP